MATLSLATTSTSIADPATAATTMSSSVVLGAAASNGLTASLTSNAANASLATTPATTPTTIMAITMPPKRLGYSISTAAAAAAISSSSLSSSTATSVICEEVFDDTCQPSAEEISDYAILLGIDNVKESHLLYLAKEGLMAALPPEWKICYSEEKSGHYYYNTKTKQSQWDHPLDAVYREIVEHARQKYANVASLAATPIIDNSDDASQLDSGIRSMQGNDLELDITATTTNDMSSPVNNGGGGGGVGGVGVGGVGVGGFNIMTKKPLTPLGAFLLGHQNSGNTVVGMGLNTNSSSLSNSNGVGGAGSNVVVSNTGTSGFSGGVSRFLEARAKNFSPVFMPLKNTRFEVAKTNPQISLAMKFGNNNGPANVPPSGTSMPMIPAKMAVNNLEQSTERKGFQLSGTGAMFLKSRRQIESGLNQASVLLSNSDGLGGIGGESGAGTPPGVKGILRDSSLTDMRRRIERDYDYEHGGISSEENKRVRFNLEEIKMRCSPEEEQSSSRKLTQSPEASINSDDDAEGDDDLWDDDGENNEDDDDDDDDDDGLVCVGSISLDSSGGAAAQRPLASNPFLPSSQTGDKHIRDIRVISVPKAQTIQMLKAQSFSIELPDRERRLGGSNPNELARSQSVEVAAPPHNQSAVSYLDKLKDISVVKPLYEDTDSDSKGSSVRSFIINKSEQDSMHSSTGPTNPFDLDELGRKHSRDVEQLQRKLNQATALSTEKTGMRTLKMASKLVGFLKKDAPASAATIAATDPFAATGTPIPNGDEATIDFDSLKQNLSQERQLLLKDERERMEEQLQQEIDAVKREHEQKLKSIRHEYDLRLTSHQHQMDEALDLQLDDYRVQLDEELDAKRKLVVNEHKVRMATLQTNHTEILQDLERDLKSEEEILKKEHATRLMQMRDKLAHELEMEKHRMREQGDDRLYEKVRCEKRLLEDKYRCLKEKYVRLKTDVKLSLERRNRRREGQAMIHQSIHTNTNTNTTTGSETERSISNKPSIGNSENRSLSYSTSCQERGGDAVTASTATAGKAPANITKPPLPPKTHLTAAAAAAASANSGKGGQQHTTHAPRDRSADRSQATRKPGIASKYIKHLRVNDDTTSISQSDTTISNNYTKGRYLPSPVVSTAAPGTGPPPPVLLVSDNGNSDSEAFNQCNNQENNNNSSARANGRKKLFSRTKSASTSRLNNAADNYGKLDRPCTPVENLRHQLQKLEDLEDQFPDNTLDTTYHLRYPFTDISNDHASGGGGGTGAAGIGGTGVIGAAGTTSSELEFFKHRIHLERDSVRRAKESLRTQRTNFRARQREIKQRHKTTIARHTLDQLIQEEKELTEMEVNLHRTRALLGEKVIRLRHLEQSLMRIYEKEKPANVDLLSVEQQKDDAATLSDLSSHSSSGFSSTDFASGTDMHNLNKRKEYFQQESNECIQNLEILNAEIREILDILGQRRGLEHNGTGIGGGNVGGGGVAGGGGGTATMSIPMISPSELSWSNMLSNNSNSATATLGLVQHHHHHHQQQQQQHQHHHHQQQQQTSAAQNNVAAAAAAAAAAAVLHAPQSIPTLADRLETYRQLAAGRMHTSMGGAILAANTIVSQNPRAVNYTTSLVERTRDLRNWLRQAKTEHELLVGLSMQHGVPFNVGTAGVANTTGNSIVGGGSGGGIGNSNIVVGSNSGAITGTPSSASMGVGGGGGGVNGAQTNL